MTARPLFTFFLSPVSQLPFTSLIPADSSRFHLDQATCVLYFRRLELQNLSAFASPLSLLSPPYYCASPVRRNPLSTTATMLFYVLFLLLALCFPVCGRFALFFASGIASSIAPFVILVLFAAPVVSQIRAVSNASSSSLEPLSDTVPPPEPPALVASPRSSQQTRTKPVRKSRASSSLSVATAIVPPRTSPSIPSHVVGAQHHSSTDSHLDIDSLASSFAKCNLTATLRPCRKCTQLSAIH